MKKADSEFIKGRIAPCGLHCGKCFAFADGDISYHSNELKRSLGNFDVYAQRFVAMLDEPVSGSFVRSDLSRMQERKMQVVQNL